VSPTDAADWHPARPAADVFWDLRCFGICCWHRSEHGVAEALVPSACFGTPERRGPIFPRNANLDLTAEQVVFKVNILVGPIGH
jgi:hypothetical protein